MSPGENGASRWHRMVYTCTDCEWGVDDGKTDDAGTAVIEHYVETGHAVEQVRDRASETPMQADDSHRSGSD